jgi:hypothetical protein
MKPEDIIDLIVRYIRRNKIILTFDDRSNLVTEIHNIFDIVKLNKIVILIYAKTNEYKGITVMAYATWVTSKIKYYTVNDLIRFEQRFNTLT